MSDLISRQAAIDAIRALWDGTPTAQHVSAMFDCEDVIQALPSAQPEEIALHESCTDCPLYDKDRHSCPRFNKVIPETLRELQSAQPEIIHCRECQHWKQGELVDKCGLLDCYADADCYCAWAVRERRQDE